MSLPAFARNSVHILSRQEVLRYFPLPTAENKLDSFSPVATENVKREIIAAARDGCEVYFSRLFPATVRVQLRGRSAWGSPCPWLRCCPGPQGSVGTGVQILAVSHTGIKLLRMVKGTNVSGEQLRVLRAYR